MFKFLGDDVGKYYRVMKGDTRSLDNGSYKLRVYPVPSVQVPK